MHLQPDAHQAAEVAKAFRAGEGIGGCLVSQDLPAGTLEGVAEVGPGLARAQLGDAFVAAADVVGHVCLRVCWSMSARTLGRVRRGCFVRVD